MCDSKSFSFFCSFSSSSSSSTFDQGGIIGGGRERSFSKHGGGIAAHTKTTSSAPLSCCPLSYQQSSPPPSPWRFTYPPSTVAEMADWIFGMADEETEDSDSECAYQENDVPGVEVPIKKDKHEVTEPEQSSSQIILVSRILKGIPQSPHFLPLKGYSYIVKLSLMNAWDRIFEQVVDQIQSMQVNSFWVDSKRLWETMGELQKMGYDVIAVRRRLVELTDVMLRLRQHRSEIRELKSKAKEHMMEKGRLVFEIVKLSAKIEAFMVKVDRMEQEIPKFDNVFSEIASKKIDIR